ncbi:uncharacterized protein A1O5_03269 [Cladophialophora psammophila CBS 110553]|uniref:Arrestin-like N-terminal domain-containing protein n=1 Tax=Cladophialophora psammophila CBS 110553 TaxID=1182543 RepID=W9WZZ7_9EURO|nr:uncharacterized protein A1O5_03269 [Cladophialophora psammophila CBS 110553]EXJ73508.1 hypothetical protein A1O5_03269 [Cladophialophora psammophila CBS 110553]
MPGVITSSVGYRNALEDIITLTDVKAVSDFRQCTCIGQEDTRKGRHLDYYFELPTTISTADSRFRPLPLTGAFTGTTTIVQSTALSDHRVAHGECEVSYWIEAIFRLSGMQVGFLNQHIQISSLYPSLRASLRKGTPLTIRAKPDILARCRFQKCPDLSLTLPEGDMTIQHDPKTGKRHISLPLAVAMGASESFPMDARQSLKCSVEAKWEVNTRFSVTPGHPSIERLRAGEAVYITTTASTHKTTILFRPLPQYDDQRAQNVRTNAVDPYLATSQLDMPVPDAVSQPSLNWKYLSRTYRLDLSLTFHGGQGAPKYSLHTGIPLSIAAYGSKADDAAKNQVVVDVSEVASDRESDGEDDLSDLLVPLGMSAMQRPQGQRASTRTPPPAYFR